MIDLSPETPIYISLTPIDFRVGINRLAARVAEVFDEDPLKGGIFLFYNRRKTDIKLLYYDVNGYLLGHKRLSRGKLSWWPRTREEALSINVSQLSRLLKGLDPRNEFSPEWQKLQDRERAKRCANSFSTRV